MHSPLWAELACSPLRYARRKPVTQQLLLVGRSQVLPGTESLLTFPSRKRHHNAAAPLRGLFSQVCQESGANLTGYSLKLSVKTKLTAYLRENPEPPASRNFTFSTFNSDVADLQTRFITRTIDSMHVYLSLLKTVKVIT